MLSTGDTRWTSHYQAVKAIRLNLPALVLILQDIHCCDGDLSSEADGLLAVEMLNPTKISHRRSTCATVSAQSQFEHCAWIDSTDMNG